MAHINNSGYFDLHCDTAFECVCNLDGISIDMGAGQLSLDRGTALSPWYQIFAIFMPDELNGKALRGALAKEHYERVLAYINDQERLFPERFVACRSKDDFQRALPDGACHAIISVEGGSALCCDISRLERLYADGVRLMTLTWNANNEIASGVGGDLSGLTEFGKEVVSYMERLGMIVDVSHLSDNGFYDVAEMTYKPFVASHSCSRALCSHTRNLTDEMFGVIRDRGGLVGINFYKFFLRDDGNACADDILRHTEHFLSLGGEDVLCLGSDFDGADMSDGITGIESIPSLRERFLKANYSESLVNKLFFGNAYGFFANNIK